MLTLLILFPLLVFVFFLLVKLRRQRDIIRALKGKLSQAND